MSLCSNRRDAADASMGGGGHAAPEGPGCGHGIVRWNRHRDGCYPGLGRRRRLPRGGSFLERGDTNRANNDAQGRVSLIQGDAPGELLTGTFCPPAGGDSTGGGGTATGSHPWLGAIALVAVAGLVAGAVRVVRR
jgi:hypothetical protein